MGDYVNKGPISKQTLHFVRDLTMNFLNRVTAKLGNHELELLGDRDSRIAPKKRYASYSYASIHPGENHNYFHHTQSIDSNNRLVLDLLYEASMEVYSHGAHDFLLVSILFIVGVPRPLPFETGRYSSGIRTKLSIDTSRVRLQKIRVGLFLDCSSVFRTAKSTKMLIFKITKQFGSLVPENSLQIRLSQLF